MKDENMYQLVSILSKFIKSGDYWCNPKNDSSYIEIFLDENKKGSRLHLDEFTGELSRRLIASEGIKELDVNDSNHNPDCIEQKNYNLFYNTWYSWNLLYDELIKKGKIK